MINKIKKILIKSKLRNKSLFTSRNLLHQLLLYIFYKKNKKLIKSNKSIHNSYNGQRCFILFTGTSLIDLDFDIIKNENIITSGKAFLHKDFNKLNPVAVFQPGPWELRSLNLLEFISSCIYRNTNNGCHVFFDTTAYPYLSHIVESRLEDTYFLSQIGNYISSDNIQSDLHKPNNIQEGALSIGLGIASYMGFKEIYLLGSDFLTDPPVYGHFYDGFYEVADAADYESYRERASWMIRHIEKKGCRVINVIKDEKQASSIGSVTFEELKVSLSN